LEQHKLNDDTITNKDSSEISSLSTEKDLQQNGQEYAQNNFQSLRKKSLIQNENISEWSNEEIELIKKQYQQELKHLTEQEKEPIACNDTTTNPQHARRSSLIRSESLFKWTNDDANELKDEIITEIKRLQDESAPASVLLNHIMNDDQDDFKKHSSQSDSYTVSRQSSRLNN